MKGVIGIVFGLIGGIFLGNEAFSQSGERLAQGLVVSQGQPVAQVAIVVQGQRDTVHSDAEGFFQLPVSPLAGTLLFLSADYNPFSFPFDAETSLQDLRISLATYAVGSILIQDDFPSLVRTVNPVPVSEIGDPLFEATQSVSLSEALSFVPGLRMETNCQNCGFSQLRMNGLPGAYSQILIDGRPVFSALNGIYGLDQIPAAMVERVEVTRGSGQVQYGSGAIGGTVNVVTRDPRQNAWELGLNQGWVGLAASDWVGTANVSRVAQDFRRGVTAFGVFRSRDPYDHDGDTYTEVTKLRSGSAGFRSFWRPTLQSRWVLEGHWLREYRRGGNLLFLAPDQADIAEELQSTVGGGNLSFEHYSANLRHRLSVYWSGLVTRMDNYYGGGQDPNGYGLTRDLTLLAGTQYLYHFSQFLGGKASFSAGWEAKSDRMRDEKPGYGLFVDQQLALLGIYAQHDWQVLPRLQWIPGLRLDYNSVSHEWLPNPRVHLKWQVAKGLNLRASYAKGFRAPQVFSEDVHVELVAGEIQAIRLGESLASERSDAYTLAAHYGLEVGNSTFNWAVDAFYTRIRNPFVLEQVPQSHLFILEKLNGPAASVRGINAEMMWDWARSLTFQGSITLQNSAYDSVVVWSAEVDPTQLTRQFLRTPNVYGNWVAYWQPKHSPWLFSASAVWTGRMLVPHYAGFVAEDRLVRSPAFWEANWRIGYDWDFGKDFCLNVYGGVQNLFNQYQPDLDRGPLRDASYVYGPSRPRTVFVGMKLGKGRD